MYEWTETSSAKDTGCLLDELLPVRGKGLVALVGGEMKLSCRGRSDEAQIQGETKYGAVDGREADGGRTAPAA